MKRKKSNKHETAVDVRLTLAELDALAIAFRHIVISESAFENMESIKAAHRAADKLNRAMACAMVPGLADIQPACEVCGCTEGMGCSDGAGGPCHWINTPTMTERCSCCRGKPIPAQIEGAKR